MHTVALWQQIYETLTREIGSGHYPRGQKLPTEAALARRFDVNRHTIRRALASLQEDGLIHVRQGAGAFVSQAQIDYCLGKKTRFSQNLSETGLDVNRNILRLETLPASKKEAGLLALHEGDRVHVLEAVSIIDGAPFSYSSSIFPAKPMPDLQQSLRTNISVTAALMENGVMDYSRAWTKLTAKRALGPVARVLHITDGAPVLRTVSLNVDAQGTPIEYGRSWFHADRAQLVVAGDAYDSVS
ncbi:phosphonate metabolism transcriptional regulator PhnF [Rhodobacterales bacterium 52_120_T64]|nr:phosphonate metabolism transcriptional regulator PhnF [Rhodobacterales bacterium 52_120_T64]